MEWTLERIHKTFNTNPLFFNCWVCLCTSIPETARQAVFSPSSEKAFLMCVSKYYKTANNAAGVVNDDDFPPGPRALAAAVAGDVQSDSD